MIFFVPVGYARGNNNLMFAPRDEEPQSSCSDVIEYTPNHEIALVPQNGVYALPALALVPSTEGTADVALALVEKANKLLAGGLHKCQQWEEAKDHYFEAGARFAAAGLHTEATAAYCQAAHICRLLGTTPYEITNVVGYAVDSCHRADPLQAVELLKTQSESFEANGLALQAAKAEKEMASVLQKSGDYAAALAHYERAASLFSKDSRYEPEQQACESSSRHLLCVLGQFAEAAHRFEAHALSRPALGLSSTNSYMLSVLCHAAAASGDRFAVGIPRAQRKFSEFQDRDTNLRKGKEYELLTNLFIGFDKSALHVIDAAVAKYRSCSVLEHLETFDVIVHQARDNLFQVLKVYIDIA